MGTGHFFRFDPNGSQSRDRRSGINQLTRAFLERRCVRSTFSAADEKLRWGLFHSGLPIADAEHAILLGSLRKYMALINNGRGTPITSLRYFTALFDEVKQDISSGYWEYVARRVREAERQWPGFEVPAPNQTK